MPVAVPDPPFLVSEALRLGVTRKQLRSPRLHAPARGVRMDAARREDLRSVATAVRLALPPTAAFSHTTAAALWDLPLPRDLTGLAPLHVSGPSGARPLDAVGVVSHVGLPSRDVVLRHGLAVTSLDRTVADLAALVAAGAPGFTETDLVVVADSVLGGRGRVRPYPPDRLAERLRGMQGRRGAVPLASALDRARRFVDSPMETRLRLRLVDSGFPCPVVGADVFDDDGRWLARPDLCWPGLRIALEYDGQHHLTSARQRLNDVARQEELERLGWRVIVLLAYDVLGRWPSTEGRVLQAFLDRGVRPAEVPHAPDVGTRPRIVTSARRVD